MVRASERLMDIDNAIWTKHGWKHAGMVKPKLYKKEVMRAIGKRTFSRGTYNALENENFHTMNELLESSGRYRARRRR